MLHMYQKILLKDSRTQGLATQVKIANGSITTDEMMKQVDTLYSAINFDEKEKEERILVAEDAASDYAMFAGTSHTKKACYHLAIGKECFKGIKCPFSHDDSDVRRFKEILATCDATRLSRATRRSRASATAVVRMGT